MWFVFVKEVDITFKITFKNTYSVFKERAYMDFLIFAQQFTWGQSVLQAYIEII